MGKMGKMGKKKKKEESKSDNTKKLLTPGDVAKRMNCSVTYVYRRNDLGLMPPCIRFGRLVRWEAEDIEELIRKKRQESAENLEQAKKSKNTKKVVV